MSYIHTVELHGIAGITLYTVFAVGIPVLVGLFLRARLFPSAVAESAKRRNEKVLFSVRRPWNRLKLKFKRENLIHIIQRKKMNNCVCVRVCVCVCVCV